MNKMNPVKKMKSINNQTYPIQFFRLILLCGFFVSICTAQINKTYDLKYKFRNGDMLQYKIQQFDSTRYNIQGQIHFDTIFRHKLQTLSITKQPGQNSFSVSVKLDSNAIQNNFYPDQSSELRFYLDYEPEIQENVLSIDAKGNPQDKNLFYLPTLIPLPAHPIALNQTWQFAFQYPAQETEFFKGNTTGTGHCLFYNIQETSFDTIAIFMVELKSKTEGKIKLIRPNNTIEYNYLKDQSSTNFVYFDVAKGIITKIVASIQFETALVNKNRQFKQSSTSKLFINLLEKKPAF
jgi:hypothetical protein